jgi:DNA-binding NarL/FixJ family response regulator
MKNDKYKLTPRQEDVFNLILKGMNNIQIGRKLGITAGTAKLLSHQIMKKLGCHSKNEVMAKFL